MNAVCPVTWATILDDIDRAKRRLRKAAHGPDIATARVVAEHSHRCIQATLERDGDGSGPEAA